MTHNHFADRKRKFSTVSTQTTVCNYVFIPVKFIVIQWTTKTMCCLQKTCATSIDVFIERKCSYDDIPQIFNRYFLHVSLFWKCNRWFLFLSCHLQQKLLAIKPIATQCIQNCTNPKPAVWSNTNGLACEGILCSFLGKLIVSTKIELRLI